MNERIERILHPHFCQTALQLCMIVRDLWTKEEFQMGAEICSFISTLCSQNTSVDCKKESGICSRASTTILRGNADEYKDALKLCEEAKRMCPQNNYILGA